MVGRHDPAGGQPRDLLGPGRGQLRGGAGGSHLGRGAAPAAPRLYVGETGALYEATEPLGAFTRTVPAPEPLAKVTGAGAAVLATTQEAASCCAGTTTRAGARPLPPRPSPGRGSSISPPADPAGSSRSPSPSRSSRARTPAPRGRPRSRPPWARGTSAAPPRGTSVPRGSSSRWCGAAPPSCAGPRSSWCPRRRSPSTWATGPRPWRCKPPARCSKGIATTRCSTPRTRASPGSSRAGGWRAGSIRRRSPTARAAPT